MLFDVPVIASVLLVNSVGLCLKIVMGTEDETPFRDCSTVSISFEIEIIIHIDSQREMGPINASVDVGFPLRWPPM